MAAPDPDPAGRRPGIITVIAVLTGAGGAFGLLEVALAGGFLQVSPSSVVAQGWLPILMLFNGLDSVLSLAVAVGLWRMRRWSVYLYGGLVALNAVAGALFGRLVLGTLLPAVGGFAIPGLLAVGLLVPGLMLVVMLRHYSRMR
jgi:hypothetical protein